MLAQNFKTAKELKLSDAEFNALVTVLGMLERGELKHIPSHVWENEEKVEGDSPIYFNMDQWHSTYECGTVCCIGGSAEFFGEVSFFEGGDRDNDDLDELFYPDIDGSYESISAEHAAQALRSYLTTGKANWSVICGEEEC